MTKRRKRIRVKPGCLVSVLILTAAVVVMFLTPVFQINDIVITGSEKNAKAEVLIASKIREGKNIFTVNKKSSEKKIKALGYIEDVKIKRKLPGTIVIEVTESIPAAYLEHGDAYVGINEEGLALCRVSKVSVPSDCAIVKGLGVKTAEVGHYIELEKGRDDEYEILKKLLSTFEKYSWNGQITEIDVTKKNDIVFRYGERLKIEFGGTEDYDVKFSTIASTIAAISQNPEGVINLQTKNYVYSHVIE